MKSLTRFVTFTKPRTNMSKRTHQVHQQGWQVYLLKLWHGRKHKDVSESIVAILACRRLKDFHLYYWTDLPHASASNCMRNYEALCMLMKRTRGQLWVCTVNRCRFHNKPVLSTMPSKQWKFTRTAHCYLVCMRQGKIFADGAFQQALESCVNGR